MVEQKAVVTIVGINIDYNAQYEHLHNLLSGLLGVPTSITIESVVTKKKSIKTTSNYGRKKFGTQGDQESSSVSELVLGSKSDVIDDLLARSGSRTFQPRGMRAYDQSSPSLMRRISSNNSNSSHFSSSHHSSFEMADPPRKLSDIAESPTNSSRRKSTPLPIRMDLPEASVHSQPSLRRNSYSNSSSRQRWKEPVRTSYKRPRDSHTPSPSQVDFNTRPKKSNLKKRRSNNEVVSRQLSVAKSEIEADTTSEIIRELADSPPIVLNPFGEPLQDADIKYAFDQVDANGDGRITLKEFSQTLARLQIEIDSAKLKKLFVELDTDKNGCLDFDEFREALSKVHPTNAEIWQKMLSASTLDLRPRASDLDMDQIHRILSEKNSEWTDRIDAMHSFCKHAVQPMTRKKFDKMMRPIREHLLNQLSDLRSAVVRECCIVIAKVAMVRQAYLTRWAQRILDRLFETNRSKVEIMAISASQAIKSIIRCVPDSKKLEILTSVIKASNDKHEAARKSGFESIAFMLERTREQKIGRSSKFWKQVITALNTGMKDSSNDVREAAYLGTAHLYLLNPSRTQQNLLVNLKGARLNRFYKILEEFTAKMEAVE